MKSPVPNEEESAWAPFERLKEALGETVGPLGLAVHDLIIFPNDKAMNVVFAVDLTAFLDDAERETLRQFNEMMSEQQRHELALRQKKRVETMMREFTGTLGDVPPEA